MNADNLNFVFEEKMHDFLKFNPIVVLSLNQFCAHSTKHSRHYNVLLLPCIRITNNLRDF